MCERINDKIQFLAMNRKVIFYHVLFWISYMVLGGLMDFGRNPKYFSINIPDMFFTQLPNMAVFYSCLFVYSKFLQPLKSVLITLSLILIYGLAISLWLLNTFIIAALVHANRIGATKAPFYTFRFCIEVLWLCLIYAFFAFGYYYLRINVKQEKKLRLAEKERLEAEYAFLRAQINPHFLNNTLNFFYAKSLPLSKELADGIITLSEIMRYALEIDKDSRMTLIDEEIQHIKNVIKINQLRFNNKLKIKFEVQGTTKDVRIIPLILITIVENILKHGECTDSPNPVNITLNIINETKDIHFITYNLKKNGPKELSSGIGMENIKKRIHQHYGDHFKLSVIDNEIDYSVDLRLPQNRNSNI